MLIPYFSGVVDDINKKTCVIFDVHKDACILESIYRPSAMMCISENTKFDYNMQHINQLYKMDTLVSTINDLKRSYNIILHTDDEELLDDLLLNHHLFGFRKDNIAISTGLIKNWDLKELADFAKEKLD